VIPILPQSPANAIESSPGELPSSFRDYTKLAPLGPTSSQFPSSPKTYGLTLEQLASRLAKDLSEGSTGKGSYIISGDISQDIFRDDCVFQDPTNRVRSLSQYSKALEILFDPKVSTVEVLGPLSIDKDQRTISGRYRSRGILKLPWKPYVKAYESDIVYCVDDDGLVYEQDQKWTKSASEALRESFTPSLFSPGEKSTRLAGDNEPKAALKLFDICNGRRPAEYSDEELSDIATLVDSLTGRSYPWKYQLLPGKWKVVYIQPGPTGIGIDRRGVPFPEFSFNDQYQIFFSEPTQRVTNIGELFGPSFYVDVSGTFSVVDDNLDQTPKNLRADIMGGRLCLNSACVPLPITGTGFQEILYASDRLRIVRSVDGGGASVVQINMA
jgi:hypothetical protein